MKNGKRKKRANGEGCIRQLKDGRWEARITDGYDEFGKQHWQTFSSKSQSVVIAKLKEFQANKEQFKSEKAVKYKMREWLKIWYETYVKYNVRPSTRASYEGIINNYLISYIGNINLVDLKKVDLEHMYSKLLTVSIAGKKNNGLSVKTIKNIHLVIHKALQEALEREYIFKNVADIAKVPTLKSQNISKKEIEIYSQEEQNKLINVAKNDNVYGIVIIFALFTGMRKGEILGLQWSDIDFENQTINVNKQLSRLKNYDTPETSKTILAIQYNTKTNNSTRKVAMCDSLKKILENHYIKQKKYKKIFGNNYKNNNMVFCREDGSYLDPDTLLSKYKALVYKANIRPCTFHALRHTFATRALESGIPAKVVSTTLGHSSVQFTLDIYTHVLDDVKLDEINKLDIFLSKSLA